MLFSTKYGIGDVVYAVNSIRATDDPNNPRRLYFLEHNGEQLMITGVHVRYSRLALGREKRHEYEFHTWYSTSPYSGNAREAEFLFDTLDDARDFITRANAAEGG